jgi:hypothetical protein
MVLNDRHTSDVGQFGGAQTMRLLAVFISPLLAVAIGSFVNTAAQAQRARVFVASYGSDSNPCTFGSPCKTFQQAHDTVAAGGEITAIDSAGFQPVTINKSVTITSPNGVEAGVAAPANTAAITIFAGANAIVSLHGLTLVGADISGSAGINVVSVGNLDVVDCVIRDYSSGTGINVVPSTQATITISNTYFSNDHYGVNIQSASAPLSVTLDHLTMTKNFDSVSIFADQANALVTITNSEFSHSSFGVATATNGNNNFSNFVTLANVNFNNNNFAIALYGRTGLALSHVIDAYSITGSIEFDAFGVTTYSEGNNHLSFTGPEAPQSLGAWPQQ